MMLFFLRSAKRIGALVSHFASLDDVSFGAQSDSWRMTWGEYQAWEETKLNNRRVNLRLEEFPAPAPAPVPSPPPGPRIPQTRQELEQMTDEERDQLPPMYADASGVHLPGGGIVPYDVWEGGPGFHSLPAGDEPPPPFQSLPAGDEEPPPYLSLQATDDPPGFYSLGASD